MIEPILEKLSVHCRDATKQRKDKKRQKSLTQHIRCVTVAYMIPSFLSNGLLPAGIHWAEWSEILMRFGVNPHRRRLLNGCEKAIGALAYAGCQAVYLDGSFVTEKENPEDYDACWGMSGVRKADLDPVFLDFGNLRAAQKAKYLGEFFPALAPASEFSPLATFFQYFQIDKDSGDPKGIVAIKLKAQYDKK